jgi:energy-coupling factor transporter ATP-binding protein EcfA2
MLKLEKVGFHYAGPDPSDDRLALSGIDLTVPNGDFLGIIGPSGSGKTTLTCALNGIIPHYYRGDFYGSVTIDGHDTVEMGLDEVSRIVGSVCQDIDSQMVASVVSDELLYGLENFAFPHDEVADRLAFALRQIGIEDLYDRDIASLSGGQKQKVALAAIIALKPRVLVLDEPTAELDPQASRQVFDLLAELNATYGVTIVMVEQKIMLLSAYAKHLVAMDEGRIVCDGTVDEVLAQSALLERLGINIPRVSTLSHELDIRGITDDEVCKTVDEAVELIVRTVTGTPGNTTRLPDTDTLPHPEATEPAPADTTSSVEKTTIEKTTVEKVTGRTPLVLFDHVSAGYTGKTAVIDDVSFSVGQGEFIALCGTNGAGKSTTLRLFNGLLKPLSGTVFVDGADTRTLKTSTLARSIGFLFQNPDRQICCTTVADEIAFGFRDTPMTADEIACRVAETIDDFGFCASDEPFSLSRGERQRLALASIVAVRPRIILLDEPTTGLDYRECTHIMERVCELNDDGITVVIVCHDMEVVGDYARRVITMSQGRVKTEGTPARLFRDASALQDSSLLAPQIVELGQRLGADGRLDPAARAAFLAASSVKEMADAVERAMALEGTTALENREVG